MHNNFDSVTPAAMAAARAKWASEAGKAGRGESKRRSRQHYKRIGKLAGQAHHKRALERAKANGKQSKKILQNKC